MRRYEIDVKVKTEFIPEESSPELEQFVFTYTVTLTNIGASAARLISRHWLITDAHESLTEVQDFGVVGKHPHLQPGQSFTYTSGAVLETPTGEMKGSYLMRADDGTEFDAVIPRFFLTVPNRLH